MPKVEITSANSGHDTYTEPHERMHGPWEDHELDNGAHHLKRAGQIIKNKKYLDAIKKHAEKRAEEHHETAHQAEMLAKMGKISPKAMAKMEGKR
jgi:hypothetical protein